MKKIVIYIVVAIALLVVAFFMFNSYIYNQKQGDQTATTTQTDGTDDIFGHVGELEEGGEADPSRMTLQMNEWVWVETLYNDERRITPATAGVFTLTFGNDGKFTAKTDCNSVGGTYSVRNDVISFSDVFSTKKFCKDSQEADFIAMLTNTSNFHFTVRGQLILDLKFDSGSVVFR